MASNGDSAIREGMVLWRRRLAGWAAAILAALLAFGPRSAVAATIRVAGTGSAVETFRILGEAFRNVRPDIRVVALPSMGSSGAISAVLADKVDIALSARPLSDEERARGVVARAYARTPMAFAVNRGVKMTGLTLAEAAEIYAGKRIRWEDGRRIRLVLRPPRETDIAILKGMGPEMSAAVEGALRREGMIVAMTDQDAADAVERTPGGFGALSLSVVESEKRAVRVLALDGIAPSVRAIGNGSYPYVKTFSAVTKRRPSPAVREFLEFIRSPAGAAILSQNGQAAVR